MNEELQRLRVIIEADASALKKGVKEAQKTVDEFSKNASKKSEIHLGRLNIQDLKMQVSEYKKNMASLKEEIKSVENEISSYQEKLLKAQEDLAKVPSYVKPDQAQYAVPAMEIEKYQALISDANNKLAALNAQHMEETQRVKETSVALEEEKERVRELIAEEKKLGKEKKKSSGSKNGLLSSVGTIIKYRLLRSAISAITSNVKEGIQYLIIYEQQMGYITNHNQKLSALATNFEKLKMSVSVTALSLVTLLEPAINGLVTVLSWAIERINELLAAIKGESTYNAVNPNYWKDYAEYVKETNSKLKETKTLISGFDEINTINPTTQLFDKTLMEPKEVTALGAMQGAISALLPLLAALAWHFLKKNKLLNLQTKATELETKAVKALASAYAWALAGAAALGVALGKLWDKIKSKVPQVDWQPAFQPAFNWLGDLGEAWDRFKQKIGQGINVPITLPVPDYQPVLDGLQNLVDTVPSYVTSLNDAWDSFPAHISESMDSLVGKFPKWVNELADAFSSFPATISNLMEGVLSIFPAMKEQAVSNIRTIASECSSAFSTANSNIVTFVETTSVSLADWSRNVGTNVAMACSAVATNVYNAFQNASTNIANWVNNTSSNVAKWGTSVGRNISNACTSAISAITTWVNNTGSAIANWGRQAVAAIGAVSIAQGQKSKSTSSVGSWISQQAKAARATAAMIGIAVASAVLKPWSGVKAYANGGVISKPTLGLMGEYAGASRNPEIVTPENKMREVVDSSNNQLASVYAQVGRQIIQAIENKDMSVTIGDMEIGRACARANNTQKRMTGKALIA